MYWIDINSTCTWENLKTIDNYLPTTCITTGWLVSTKNNCHKFVSDISLMKIMELLLKWQYNNNPKSKHH